MAKCASISGNELPSHGHDFPEWCGLRQHRSNCGPQCQEEPRTEFSLQFPIPKLKPQRAMEELLGCKLTGKSSSLFIFYVFLWLSRESRPTHSLTGFLLLRLLVMWMFHFWCSRWERILPRTTLPQFVSESSFKSLIELPRFSGIPKILWKFTFLADKRSPPVLSVNVIKLRAFQESRILKGAPKTSDRWKISQRRSSHGKQSWLQSKTIRNPTLSLSVRIIIIIKFLWRTICKTFKECKEGAIENRITLLVYFQNRNPVIPWIHLSTFLKNSTDST